MTPARRTKNSIPLQGTRFYVIYVHLTGEVKQYRNIITGDGLVDLERRGSGMFQGTVLAFETGSVSDGTSPHLPLQNQPTKAITK
jgi:hypothetical protein